jgi:hypothetical protein
MCTTHKQIAANLLSHDTADTVLRKNNGLRMVYNISRKQIRWVDKKHACQTRKFDRQAAWAAMGSRAFFFDVKPVLQSPEHKTTGF